MSGMQMDHTDGKPLRWPLAPVPGLSLLSACIERAGVHMDSRDFNRRSTGHGAARSQATEQRFQRARLEEE